MVKSYDVPTMMCLSCGTLLEAATNPYSNNKPRAGSITICFRCGHLMAFDKKLRVRELTGDEMRAVAGDKRILEIQTARAMVLKQATADNSLSIWTVYDHPSDYPEFYVARRFEYDRPTEDVLLFKNIDVLRDAMMARGLTKLMRNDEDDAVIMETWL